MNKPKLLIPLTIQFSVRYVIRTGLIKQLKEFTEPVVLLGWHDESIEYELEELGIDYSFIPELKKSIKYQRVRRFLETWHRKTLKSPTRPIDDYRNRLTQGISFNFKREGRDYLFNQLSKNQSFVSKMISVENQLIFSETNLQDYIEIIKKLSPDFVLTTLPGKNHEEIILRAANELGIPVFAAILSFDNITTHNWISAKIEGYCVWNKYNKAELLRSYPRINPESIHITGSPQFDFYFKNESFLNENEWRRAQNLPPEKKIILFGASPPIIAPIEPYWLHQLDTAIQKGRIYGSPTILFRRHPVDSMLRWQSVLSKCKNTISYDSWHGPNEKIHQVNITKEDIVFLASALKYCTVHINTSSTMTIDGAILDRPQIGFAYDDQKPSKYHRAMQELYLREHFLPITNSGGLTICRSEIDMINTINYFLTHPEAKKVERKKMVLDVCTYDDGKCTERVVEAVKSFITGHNQ